jgi:hypothetical protein
MSKRPLNVDDPPHFYLGGQPLAGSTVTQPASARRILLCARAPPPPHPPRAAAPIRGVAAPAPRYPCVRRTFPCHLFSLRTLECPRISPPFKTSSGCYKSAPAPHAHSVVAYCWDLELQANLMWLSTTASALEKPWQPMSEMLYMLHSQFFNCLSLSFANIARYKSCALKAAT